MTDGHVTSAANTTDGMMGAPDGTAVSPIVENGRALRSRCMGAHSVVDLLLYMYYVVDVLLYMYYVARICDDC